MAHTEVTQKWMVILRHFCVKNSGTSPNTLQKKFNRYRHITYSLYGGVGVKKS
nr:hypothetical protein [Cressdnaviricota sp.]